MPLGGSVPVRKRAGQRRTPVTLWSASSTRDVIGGQPSGVFAQFGTDQAAIDEVPFIMNATEHGVLYKVTVKYRRDIVTEFETSKKRVQIRGGGKTLNLLEIENAERRNIELILHCAVA
jgi:hypothetical protein